MSDVVTEKALSYRNEATGRRLSSIRRVAARCRRGDGYHRGPPGRACRQMTARRQAIGYRGMAWLFL